MGNLHKRLHRLERNELTSFACHETALALEAGEIDYHGLNVLQRRAMDEYYTRVKQELGG